MSTERNFGERNFGLFVESFDARAAPAPLAGVLFADDFDLTPPAARPDPATPPPTALDVEQARAQGFEQGARAAAEQAAQRVAAATQSALTALAEALAQARAQSDRHTRATAEHLSRTILQTLAIALPELCDSHGAAEVHALVASLLPLLAQQPQLCLRANPHSLAGLRAVVDRQPPGPRAAISLVPTDALAEGDVSLEWQDGAARRETRLILDALAAALAPLGVTLPAAPAPAKPAARKETAHA